MTRKNNAPKRPKIVPIREGIETFPGIRFRAILISPKIVPIREGIETQNLAPVTGHLDTSEDSAHQRGY